MRAGIAVSALKPPEAGQQQQFAMDEFERFTDLAMLAANRLQYLNQALIDAGDGQRDIIGAKRGIVDQLSFVGDTLFGQHAILDQRAIGNPIVTSSFSRHRQSPERPALLGNACVRAVSLQGMWFDSGTRTPDLRGLAAALLYSANTLPVAGAITACAMDFLPLFLDIRARRCVIVGGGPIAARKVALVLAAGARIEVIAPAVEAELRALADSGQLVLTEREFVESDVTGAMLVIAATGTTAVNARIAATARAAGILVNVVDQPAECTVIMPSIIDRSPVVIAIGTAGTAPVLARMLRAKLESMIPQAYGELARVLGSLRGRVRLALPEARSRRHFWERVLESPAVELLFAGRRAQALRAIEDMLSDAASAAGPRGEVYLIGCGPGDPDLLTFRALRLMQHADVVVYDRLVGTEIVDLCRRDAERIYVGKSSQRQALSQAGINELLVNLARAGKRTARLKGGDPFLFGRGGEEIEHLAAAGIHFQIVPGVTAALGCAAYAGIPLTHRDLAHSCVFVTGHRQAGGGELDWPALVRPRQTVVVYMGVAALGPLCEQLQKHGMHPDLPAALIERGTTAAQRVVTATVSTLADAATRASIEPPALAIIGEVVRLREQMQWYEPLGTAAS